MKMSSSYLVIGIVFLIVIIMSLGCSCTKVSPYYKDNLFTNEYPYEGFAPLSPAKFGQAGNLVSLPSVKTEGFEGLQSAPFTKEIPIDIFSQAQGNISCPPVGYSNSRGPLCLDQNQKNLLLTRGGNSSGKDSEIGSV